MRLSYPTAVGLATQAIVGVLKVAEHDRLQKIIHVTRARRVTASILHACSSPDPWIPSHTRMFDRYLDFFSLTTANFAISGSDGLTFLLVDSASKTRVFFFWDHSVTGFTTAVGMLPRTGQDHFDGRPGMYHCI